MIPKVIHYLWFGDKEIPENDRKCMETWYKFCPDYEIICWNESNYDITKNQYMKEAYEAKKWGFVVDFARLDIIYNYGGIYLDTDVELVKSPDSLLDNHGFMGFEESCTIANGQGFGAEKGNPVIKYLMDQNYSESHFINPDGSLNNNTSTVYNTEAYRKKGVRLDNSYQIVDDAMTILPSDYLCPLNPDTGKLHITHNTVSIHHFDGSWASERDILTKDIKFKVGRVLPVKMTKLVTDSLVTIKLDGFNTFIKKIYKSISKKKHI